MRTITTAQYAAVISTVAFCVSFAGLYISKLSYDLSVARDQRELREKTPAIDVQMRPAGLAAADITISIANRAAINISPQSITVEPSFDVGELYFSNAQQSVDRLKSTLSLIPMGTIAPKGVATMKARLSGVTDGKTESVTPGLELQFSVQIRFADEQDSVRTFDIVR